MASTPQAAPRRRAAGSRIHSRVRGGERRGRDGTGVRRRRRKGMKTRRPRLPTGFFLLPQGRRSASDRATRQAASYARQPAGPPPSLTAGRSFSRRPRPLGLSICEGRGLRLSATNGKPRWRGRLRDGQAAGRWRRGFFRRAGLETRQRPSAHPLSPSVRGRARACAPSACPLGRERRGSHGIWCIAKWTCAKKGVSLGFSPSDGWIFWLLCEIGQDLWPDPGLVWTFISGRFA